MGNDMTLFQLFSELEKRGIQLRAEKDMLAFHPRSAVTPDLEEKLKSYKQELLVIVRNASYIDPQDANSVWQLAVDDIEKKFLFPDDMVDVLRDVNAQWVHNDIG